MRFLVLAIKELTSSRRQCFDGRGKVTMSDFPAKIKDPSRGLKPFTLRGNIPIVQLGRVKNLHSPYREMGRKLFSVMYV
jgi:hypothetical protein